jgi:hypothetical protein
MKAKREFPSMLCVYAVCSRLRVRVDLAGIAGEPLRFVAGAGLAAVVGRVGACAAREHRSFP